MPNPITTNEVRNFIAWQFFTRKLVKKGDKKQDQIQSFVECLDLSDIEFDGDDAVYLVRELLHAIDGRAAHALYHLCMGMAKWQPTERDLLFLCGAEELVEAA